MNAQRLTEIIVKFWAIFWIAHVIANIPQFFIFHAGRATDEILRISEESGIANIVCSLIVACLLIAFARRIAQFIAPDESLALPITAEQGLMIGLAILGASFAADGIVRATVPLYTLLTKPRWVETPSVVYVLERTQQMLVQSIASLVVGGALLISAPRLASTLISIAAERPTKRDSSDHDSGD